MPYQVVWNRCNVFNDQGEAQTLLRGENVPDEIDDVQKSQLAVVGAVQFVDTTIPDSVVEAVLAQQQAVAETDAARKADPDGFEEPAADVPVGFVEAPAPGEPPAFTEEVSFPENEADDGEGRRPSKSATKPEWEDYAVSLGMSREEAVATGKQALIARFGG